jgi:hypothetical protein
MALSFFRTTQVADRSPVSRHQDRSRSLAREHTRIECAPGYPGP